MYFFPHQRVFSQNLEGAFSPLMFTKEEFVFWLLMRHIVLLNGKKNTQKDHALGHRL